MSGALRVALDAVHVLAEGPVWDHEHERLLWVDIKRGLVFVGALGRDGLIAVSERITVPGTAGAVAPARGGGMVIAGTRGLLVCEEGGTPREWTRLLDDGDERRLNDGKVDPAGRFIVGTKSEAGTSTAEQYLAVKTDGSVQEVDGDLTLANGLAWSSDGRLMYSVDTLTQRIHVRDFDPGSGATGDRRTFATLERGYPDGICIDAEDHVWVAVWGEGEVQRRAPDGRLVSSIEVPAPHTSSLAFAGPSLETLVITTASDELTSAQIAEHPGSGQLFAIEPGVAGLPQPLWQGPTHDQTRKT